MIDQKLWRKKTLQWYTYLYPPSENFPAVAFASGEV